MPLADEAITTEAATRIKFSYFSDWVLFYGLRKDIKTQIIRLLLCKIQILCLRLRRPMR